METTPTLDELIGKTVLIGITRLGPAGEVIEQRQLVGTFESMDMVIHIALKNGEDFVLPPDLTAFQRAQPGTYRLRSTGEEIENPDYTSLWTATVRD